MLGLPYIKNRALFMATLYAVRLRWEGIHPDVADARAGERYNIPPELITRYAGMARREEEDDAGIR